jgi:formate dehydrogenase major subunit
MEKSMLGEAGYMTRLPKPTLNGMIDVIKGIEPDTGYGMILNVSEAESAMRESRTRRTKTVCTIPKISVFRMRRDELPIRPGQIPGNWCKIGLVPPTKSPSLDSAS